MPVFSFRLPLRFLRGSYSRLALTVIALACGVALVCAIDLVNRAVLRAFVEVIDTMAGRAALQVTAGGTGLFPEEIAEQVAAVPGVELAVPVVSATAFTVEENAELLTIHGVDLTNEKVLDVYGAGNLRLDDPLEFLSQGDSILVTESFAAARGLNVGSRIGLETPIGRRTFTVRGLLEPKGIAHVYGRSLVAMDLFAAESSFARAGYVNRVDVVVKVHGNLEQVRKGIESILSPGLRLELPAQRKADLHRAIASLQFLLRAVSLTALVAAFLIAFNRLSCMFDGRTWQMGIMKAVGLTQVQVRWEFLKESLILGTAGVVVGVPFGIALGSALLPIIAATTALNSKMIAPEAELALSARSIAISVALGLFAAFLSAWLPAWRAAQASPIEAIRGRGTELPDAKRTPLVLLRLGIVLALVVTMVLQVQTGAVTFGLIATVLTVVATSLVARPLLEQLSGAWTAGATMIAGPIGRFASAFVRLNPRRTARSAAMLGVGLGAVFWLGMIAYSFRESALRNLGQAMKADLIVSSANVASGYLEVPISDRVLSELRNLRGVEEVIGVRILDWPYSGGEIALDAFDPEYFRENRFGEWPLLEALADSATVWNGVADGTGVVVSSNFALNLGAKLGDRVELATPRGPLGVSVLGITTDFASPRGTIEMSRELYTRYWNDSQITRAFVQVGEHADATTVREAILTSLGGTYRLRVISSGELLDYFGDQIERAFVPLDILAAMVLFVVLLGMSDTLAAGMIERTKELGTMRAIGAQRRDLRRLAIAEALIPGTLGYILAVSSGLLLGVTWVRTTFPFLLGWVLDVHVPWLQMLMIGLLTLVVCTLGSVLPALQAARLEVADALRYE